MSLAAVKYMDECYTERSRSAAAERTLSKCHAERSRSTAFALVEALQANVTLSVVEVRHLLGRSTAFAQVEVDGYWMLTTKAQSATAHTRVAGAYWIKAQQNGANTADASWRGELIRTVGSAYIVTPRFNAALYHTSTLSSVGTTHTYITHKEINSNQ